MNDFTAEYRTESGKNLYRFRFITLKNETVRVYVLDRLPHNGTHLFLHLIHREISFGKTFVDSKGSLKTLNNAFCFAMQWAEHSEQNNKQGECSAETSIVDYKKYMDEPSLLEKTFELPICEDTISEIRDYIGLHPAERGGILGRDDDGVIRHFVPDSKGRCTSGAYDPNIREMNKVIKKWKKQGIEFCGFVHSHPPHVRSLSGPDEQYAGEILAAFKKLEKLWLPLVMTVPDTGRFEIIPYAVIPGEKDRKECEIYRAFIASKRKNPNRSRGSRLSGEWFFKKPYKKNVVLTDKTPKLRESHSNSGFRSGSLQQNSEGTKCFGNFEYIWQNSRLNESVGTDNVIELSQERCTASLQIQKHAEKQRDKYFDRMKEGYDIDLLDRTRLIYIGAGGAASLIRNAARMGTGEHVIIDPDIISESNISTQQVSKNAINASKVDALAQDIIDIDPAAAVLAVCAPIENINDEQFKMLLYAPLRYKAHSPSTKRFSDTDPLKNRNLDPLRPKQTILLGLTDKFDAQGRTHRLGLQFGIPTICAQEYIEGRGAEVTYTIPGVTPACHRCITASRYKAYLEEGYKNDVTSENAPIFAAEYLNAVLGHVLLAVIHHDTEHPRWGNVIARLGNRNLIRLRMDPDFDNYFGDTFQRRFEGAKGASSFFMLDTLFLSQTPDCGQSPSRPICPDCGGTGDLRRAIGTFKDTRKLQKNQVLS